MFIFTIGTTKYPKHSMMYRKVLVFALLLTASHAAINDACTAGSTPGVCLATSSCTSAGGTTHTGFCPNDPADVKCCTKACGTGGTCRFTSTCTTGNIQTGLCPGPSSFTCCLPKSGGSSSCAPPSSVNAATTALIKNAEGFVPRPAPDPINLPTVGYGHLCQTKGCSEVPFPFPLTTTTASELLETDLKTYINCIYNDVKSSIKLNDNQFGALVSWTFNVGCANAGSSTLVKRLNNGETPDTVAAEELPKWDLAGNVVQPGLVTRRANEVKLFKTSSSKIVHPSC